MDKFSRLAGYINDGDLCDLQMHSIDAEVKNIFNESAHNENDGDDGFLGGNGHWASQSVDFGELEKITKAMGKAGKGGAAGGRMFAKNKLSMSSTGVGFAGVAGGSGANSKKGSKNVGGDRMALTFSEGFGGAARGFGGAANSTATGGFGVTARRGELNGRRASAVDINLQSGLPQPESPAPQAAKYDPASPIAYVSENHVMDKSGGRFGGKFGPNMPGLELFGNASFNHPNANQSDYQHALQQLYHSQIQANGGKVPAHLQHLLNNSAGNGPLQNNAVQSTQPAGSPSNDAKAMHAQNASQMRATFGAAYGPAGSPFAAMMKNGFQVGSKPGSGGDFDAVRLLSPGEMSGGKPMLEYFNKMTGETVIDARPYSNVSGWSSAGLASRGAVGLMTPMTAGRV